MSNQWLSNVAIFTIGAAIGSVVTWKLLKTKYERIAQEEIDSVKEAFLERDEKEQIEKEMVKEYENVISSYIPIDTRVMLDNEKPGPVKVDRTEPYVISPDMYGEADFEMMNLTYYADGVLVVDVEDRIVKDIVDMIGPDAIGSIGEYQDDVVHVRDEDNNIDYEIVRDPRKYIDAIGINTPFMENE